jgi:hypothetical protein
VGAANEVRKTGGVLFRKQPYPSSTYFFLCANAVRVSSFISAYLFKILNRM